MCKLAITVATNFVVAPALLSCSKPGVIVIIIYMCSQSRTYTKLLALVDIKFKLVTIHTCSCFYLIHMPTLGPAALGFGHSYNYIRQIPLAYVYYMYKCEHSDITERLDITHMASYFKTLGMHSFAYGFHIFSVKYVITGFCSYRN